MTPAQAAAHVADRMGCVVEGAEPLSGGLLNQVFRVRLVDGTSVVVKFSPPYVASAPHIPLDVGRCQVEATALDFLGGACAPRLLDHQPQTLIMEDIGDWPDLAAHLQAGGTDSVLEWLALWLRSLHDGPTPNLANLAVQRTRMAIQYSPAGSWLARRGHPKAQRVGSAMTELGQRFVRGGKHFVMGDLWPPSVRVRGPRDVVVIDWELATCGHRAQDLGHLLAHLHLEAHICPTLEGSGKRFLDAYGPISAEELRDTLLHQAAELLARTIGSFPRPHLPPALVAELVEDAAALVDEALDL